MRTLPEEAVQSGNRRVRARVVEQLRQDAGADRKLSGIRNGVPLRVKTTKREYNGQRVVIGRIMAGPPRQRAPWFWLEEGTRAGYRGPKVGRYNSARANRGQHPGTDPKRTWSKAVGEVLPEVRQEIERMYREALKG